MAARRSRMTQLRVIPDFGRVISLSPAGTPSMSGALRAKLEWTLDGRTLPPE